METHPTREHSLLCVFSSFVKMLCVIFLKIFSTFWITMVFDNLHMYVILVMNTEFWYRVPENLQESYFLNYHEFCKKGSRVILLSDNAHGVCLLLLFIFRENFCVIFEEKIVYFPISRVFSPATDDKSFKNVFF